MPSIICPNCHEANPTEAVMCWSCYTSLNGFNLSGLRVGDEPPGLHYPQTPWWKEIAENSAPILVIIGLISSGWWRGRTRFWVLGGLTGLIATVIALQKKEEIRVARLKKKFPDEFKSPIARIADTILFYAVHDNATQIRMNLYPRGIQVEYNIAGEWDEQMKIPLYIWKPLKDEWETRADSGAILVEHQDKKAQFKLRMVIEPPHQEILLIRLEE